MEKQVRRHYKCGECGEVFNHGIGLKKHQRESGHQASEADEIIESSANSREGQDKPEVPTSLDEKLSNIAKDLEWKQLSSNARELKISKRFLADLDDFCGSLFNSTELGATFRSEVKYGFGHALGHKVVNWMWSNLSPGLEGSKSKVPTQVLAIEIEPSERESFTEELNRLGRDFALETGVTFPTVVFNDGQNRAVVWKEKKLGTYEPGQNELLRELLRENAWRFLTIESVEHRLQKLWADRPDLQRLLISEAIRLSSIIRILQTLLIEGGSLRHFESVMEIILMNRFQSAEKWVECVKDAYEDQLGPLKREKTSHRDRETARKAKSTFGEGDLYKAGLKDDISLELGRALYSLVETNKGQPLLERITSLRLSISAELGFVPSEVTVRDNLTINPNLILIRVRGKEVLRSDIYPDRVLAIGPDHQLEKLAGITAQEPAFKLPAVWILPEQRAKSEHLGCCIFTAESVVAMALSKIIKDNASELFDYETLGRLLSALKLQKPHLVELFSSSPLLRKPAKGVFCRLLEERVPICDQVTILETLIDLEDESHSTDTLTEIIRAKLGPAICEPYLTPDGELGAAFLSPEMETLCRSCLETDSSGKVSLVPNPEISSGVESALQILLENGVPELLITTPELRRPLIECFRSANPDLVVLSTLEVPEEIEVIDFGFVRPFSATLQRRRRVGYPMRQRPIVRARKFRKRT